jgi:hypothetical protein
VHTGVEAKPLALLFSYSGGLGLNLGSEVFMVFLILSRKMPMSYFKFGHDLFLPYTFQLFSLLSDIISTEVLKSSLNKPQANILKYGPSKSFCDYGDQFLRPI